MLLSRDLAIEWAAEDAEEARFVPAGAAGCLFLRALAHRPLARVPENTLKVDDHARVKEGEAPKSRQAPIHSCLGMISGTDSVRRE
jgi:hypothetical protein